MDHDFTGEPSRNPEAGNEVGRPGTNGTAKSEEHSTVDFCSNDATRGQEASADYGAQDAPGVAGGKAEAEEEAEEAAMTPEEEAVAQSLDFLAAAFGDPEQAWTCAIAGFPSTNWTGRRGTAQLSALPPGQWNRYFLTNYIPPGAARSSKAVTAHVLFGIDDVGTGEGSKVDPARLEALMAAGLPRPTAVLETSPGNFQAFWLLKSHIPVSDAAGHKDVLRIRALLAQFDLTDPGTIDLARYMRLGGGWNSKPDHVAANGGKPFLTRYTEFDLSRRVTVEELGEGLFGADWREIVIDKGFASAVEKGEGGSQEIADLSAPGAYLTMAQELDMIIGQRGTKVDARCPNIDQHTSMPETGFAFLSDAQMCCQHSHCMDLRSLDFQRMIREQFDAEMAGRIAQGEDVDYKNAEELLHEFSTAAAAEQFLASPPDEEEIARLAAAAVAAGGEDDGDGKLPIHERAAQMLARAGIRAFLDDEGGLWLWLEGRLHDLKSGSGLQALGSWLFARGLTLLGTSGDNLVTILGLGAYAAAGEDDEDALPTVHYRAVYAVSPTDRAIYVNRMNRAGGGIRIDGDGWQIMAVEDMPVLLANRAGAQTMPLPVRPTDGVPFMDRLGRHIPLVPVMQADDPEDAGVRQRAALLTFLVGQYVRTGMVPHLAMTGQQGGGKTTTARRLNSLTDPDKKAVVPSLPERESDMFAVVARRSNLVLDNSSTIRVKQADALCVFATGGASITRALYSNHDVASVSIRCSIIFTSVLDNGLTKRPDLQDRMLAFRTPAMPAEGRKGEGELDAAWAADLPELLGGLFGLLSTGLKNVETVQRVQRMGCCPPAPRYLDVAQVAEAIAWHGLGWPPGLLTNALHGMQGDEASNMLEADPIAVRLRTFLAAQREQTWGGTYPELYDELRLLHAGPGWPPMEPLVFANALSRIAGPMRQHWYIETEQGKFPAKGRYAKGRGRSFRVA
jgi:hypothetical protein